MKILNKIYKKLYDYFVRCNMSDEEWKKHLEMKKYPAYMRYKNGCIYLYEDKYVEEPFRILRNNKIIWEEIENKEILQTWKKHL